MDRPKAPPQKTTQTVQTVLQHKPGSGLMPVHCDYRRVGDRARCVSCFYGLSVEQCTLFFIAGCSVNGPSLYAALRGADEKRE